MFKGTTWSKTQYYRRLKKAKKLGCSIYDLPDNRGKHSNHCKGEKHPRWNKKTTISEHGYLKVNVGVNHPLADSIGYTYLHLLVWCASGKEKPKKGNIIHHINGSKFDNRIENLQLLSNSQHGKLHNKLKSELDGKACNQLPEVG